jgi:UDP-glucose 4-epimerase
MDIGITGAKGFLGTHILDRLKRDSKIDSVSGFDLPEGDIFNIPSLEKFVSGKDVIIHLAALNRADDAELMRVNVLGTLFLIKVIKQKNPSCRLVFASSFQVYSKSDEKDTIDEDFPTVPVSIYGLSKRFCEEMIVSMLDNYAVLRISNIYGPGCKPFYNSVVATFVQLAKDKKPISITGKGTQSRDFVFVDDVAKAFEFAAISKENGIFNICTGESVSLNHLAELLNKDFPNIEIKHTPSEEKFISTKGDYRKAKKDLRWSPSINFEQGLKRCY